MPRAHLILLALLLAVPALRAAAHPQDGPHVDLRFEILEDAVVARVSMNLVFLDELVETPRELPEAITDRERVGVRAALLEHLRTAHPLIVNGNVIEPEASEVTVADPDPALLPLFPRSGMRGLRKIEMTLTYPLAAPATKVAFVWKTYPLNILVDTELPPPLEIAAELTAQGRREQLLFTVDEPEYIWHAPLASEADPLDAVPAPPAAAVWRLPLVTIGVSVVWVFALLCAAVLRRRPAAPAVFFTAVLVAVTGYLTRDFGTVAVERPGGPALPTDAEAIEIFAPLHANIYRAFEYVEEGDVYDTLARSVGADMLDQLYRQVYESLVMREEGGAVGRVREVRPLRGTVESVGIVATEAGPRPGFTVEYEWEVDGAVVHWGHAHERTNAYLARYGVTATDDGWRITGTQIIEQRRIDEPEPDAVPMATEEDIL